MWLWCLITHTNSFPMYRNPILISVYYYYYGSLFSVYILWCEMLPLFFSSSRYICIALNDIEYLFPPSVKVAHANILCALNSCKYQKQNSKANYVWKNCVGWNKDESSESMLKNDHTGMQAANSFITHLMNASRVRCSQHFSKLGAVCVF